MASQSSISARKPTTVVLVLVGVVRHSNSAPFIRPSVVMTSTITSSDNHGSILGRALHNYSGTTGIDLTNHPSLDKFQNCRSPDDVVQQLLGQETAFESDRDKYRDLIDRLLPVVQIVCGFSGVVDGAADLVSPEFLASDYI
jgi:fungal STAND N-terminal Goodbye domain